MAARGTGTFSHCTDPAISTMHGDDPLTAAEQFTWLTVAETLKEWTLAGGADAPAEQLLDTIAENAVATFRAWYSAA